MGRAGIVVDPFSVGRADGVHVKITPGKLLRIRTVGVGAPDSDLVGSVVERPREDNVALAALRESRDPGVRIAEWGAFDRAIHLEASYTLSVRHHNLSV